MTSEKQVEANKNNALLSTGAVTNEGKAVVARNAVKHGIFARDIIIPTGDGAENQEEYKDLLANLTGCLNPKGQMEHLLVEKIAVDFWRLRRVLRFETGSIRKYLDMVIYDYYSKKDWQGKNEVKTNKELDAEIAKQNECLDWNNAYIKALKEEKVDFNAPTWEGDNIESDITDDLYDVIRANKYRILQGDEYRQFEEGELEHPQLLSILRRAEYSDNDIANTLIEIYEKSNEEYLRKIYELKKAQVRNNSAEEVNKMISSLPVGDNAEKVMRYEKAIQKSIFQNLGVLKKLQSLPDPV